MTGAHRFDVIVVGSGFGGAITAARLAEGGARVLILERGRRWTADQYPRTSTDPWVYEHTAPEKHNGWFDLRFFPRMIVVQAAGVGGGSLCYSSVVMEANAELFEHGWPPEVTYEELKPYYARVGRMLNVRTIPDGQRTARGKLLQEAATRLGYAERYSSVPLAVSFDEEWNYDLPEPLAYHHSKRFVNAQGQQQGTCVHLGNCDIGCPVRAKNTLDLNYIPHAEQYGAEVRPLHLVRYIQPDGAGYRVVFDRIEHGTLVRGSESADRVILAAGSIGTTELLLRSRDQYRTLLNVSQHLGQGWSANANFLTPDKLPDDDRVRQGVGPTISAGLDFMDGSANGQRFFIEDDGFPNLLNNALTARLSSPLLRPIAWALQRHLKRALNERATNPTRNVMVWLGEGIDAADGQLFTRRRTTRPWQHDIGLKWNVEASRDVAEAILETHKRLSQSVGGSLYVPLYWRLLKGMLSVHPLGGAAMGVSPSSGVVDHRGEVFGHPNLYVSDGATLPGAVGRNPSMTIGALAERTAALMLQD